MINTASTHRQWNFWAGVYEKLWVQQVSLKPTRRQLLAALAPLMEPGQSCHILDVGCGTGQLIRDLVHAFPQANLRITGIDYAEGMVQQAKRSLQNLDHVSLFHMDAHDVHLLDQAFDIIVCTHSFPYYRNQLRVLEGLHQVLKPHGSLLLAQAACETLYDQVVLFFVSLTTGKAHYPSSFTMEALTRGLFQQETVTPVRERWFMPSILSFHYKKKVSS